MRIYEILIILFIHFLGDFVFQTQWQAENKSKSNLALLYHVSTYTACWFTPMLFLFYNNGFNLIGAICLSFVFCVISFICHFITDYFTSRLNSRLWADKRIHDFFVSIGWDQTMHFIQLFLTYILLKNI